MSSFELAKGHSKPVGDTKLQLISNDVVEGHEKLQASRKLAFIFKLKSSREINVATSDVIKFFSENGIKKTGTWSMPKIVLVVH